MKTVGHKINSQRSVNSRTEYFHHILLEITIYYLQLFNFHVKFKIKVTAILLYPFIQLVLISNRHDVKPLFVAEFSTRTDYSILNSLWLKTNKKWRLLKGLVHLLGLDSTANTDDVYTLFWNGYCLTVLPLELEILYYII